MGRQWVAISRATAKAGSYRQCYSAHTQVVAQNSSLSGLHWVWHQTAALGRGHSAESFPMSARSVMKAEGATSAYQPLAYPLWQELC
ncbi:hypothetical protein WJX77_012610 [Trebouxia sp. C0004]